MLNGLMVYICIHAHMYVCNYVLSYVYTYPYRVGSNSRMHQKPDINTSLLKTNLALKFSHKNKDAKISKKAS